MSILNVEHLTHGFGDRAIFEDVSFRLLKGEHIGFVGANGEGKSTFMSIVTGKLMPDEGKVEWAKNVHAGYLDQHAVLEKGMTIGQVLKSAFDPLLKKEERMNEICDKLGTADPDEMDGLMEELGTIQDELTLHDFYSIDAKVEEVARALGLLDLGLDRDVTDLSGGQRTKVLLAKLLLEKPDISRRSSVLRSLVPMFIPSCCCMIRSRFSSSSRISLRIYSMFAEIFSFSFSSSFFLRAASVRYPFLDIFSICMARPMSMELSPVP